MTNAIRSKTTTLYLVRHGEVYNPEGIIYGRLPGFGLSQKGRQEIERAGERLVESGPFAALYASPLERAQESAAILADRLGLEASVEDRIVETSIGSFQGRCFEELPRPYITEEGAHPELESAASMRERFMAWAADMQTRHGGDRVIAVSHRDPIIVALLHWMDAGLEALADFPLETGTVYVVQLGRKNHVSRLG